MFLCYKLLFKPINQIILSMRPAKNKASNQQRIYALCLNPDCTCFTRHCSVVVANQTVISVDQNHESCKRWLWRLDQHDFFSKSAQQSRFQKQDPDFLQSPLSSIELLLTFDQANWKQGITEIFDSIKFQFDKKLKQMYGRISHKVGNLIQKGQTAKRHMLQLKNKCLNKIWTSQHQQFYRENLLNNLRQIQNTGLLRIINCEGLSMEIDRIKDYMNRIQWYFWIQQPELDRLERSNYKKYEQQLSQLLQYKEIEGINRKLQEIYSAFKIKPFAFSQQTSLRCGRCSLQIHPSEDPLKVKNKQTKRSECLIALYTHLCKQHADQVIEKYIQKSSKPNIRLSLQQLLRQVSANKVKTCVVIDRQNYNSSKQVIQTKDTYVIEVVSKPRQNIAAGRYLIAQSSGKDAADIFMILILYELSKIDSKMRLVLITNDHFGKTLQPIYLSLGAKIDLISKVNNQLILQQNNQNGQMIIEE